MATKGEDAKPTSSAAMAASSIVAPASAAIATPPKTPAASPSPPATEVERALQRINGIKNVQGTIIVDKDGTIVHSTFSDENLTTNYATQLLGLTTTAQSSIRELDNQSELQMLRVRSITHEIVIVHHAQFAVLVVQGLKDPVIENKEDVSLENEIIDQDT